MFCLFLGVFLLTVDCVSVYLFCCMLFFFFFKQKTAYEMRISDWSSDVCSSDLDTGRTCRHRQAVRPASARGRGCAEGEPAPQGRNLWRSAVPHHPHRQSDRKSTRLNSSH